MHNHPDPEINALLIQLNDRLCQFERATGVGVAMVIRDSTGWEHRSLDGKPDVPNDLMDHELFDAAKR